MVRFDDPVVPVECGLLTVPKVANPPPGLLPPKLNVGFGRAPDSSVNGSRVPPAKEPKGLLVVPKGGDLTGPDSEPKGGLLSPAKPPKGDLLPLSATLPKGDESAAKLNRPDFLNLSSDVCGNSSGRSVALEACGLGEVIVANGDAAEVFEKPSGD